MLYHRWWLKGDGLRKVLEDHCPERKGNGPWVRTLCEAFICGERCHVLPVSVAQ
ncbi:MAG: hypothetical protein GXY19_21360 [Phycisphaerae bacterium]|nr:hypothetical protein [Phycisphaerae bacterium]